MAYPQYPHVTMNVGISLEMHIPVYLDVYMSVFQGIYITFLI